MKATISLFLFSFFLAGAVHAQELPDVSELQSFDEALAEMREEVRDNRLRFQVKGEIYTLKRFPEAKDIERTISNDRVNVRLGFDSMNEEERARFLELRQKTLRLIIRALHASRGVATLGLIAKDQITGIFQAAKDGDGMKEMPLRRRDVIQHLLTYIDHHLWYQAPAILKSNEYAFEVSVAAFGQAGRGDKGVGGVLEYGFSFGYNRDQKIFVFELFSKHQRPSTAMYPYFAAGARVKFGGAAFNVEKGERVRRLKASASSNLPFSGGYSEWSPHYFAMGKKATLQMPFIGNLFWYENSMDRRTVFRLRLGVAPFANGIEDMIRQVRFGVLRLQGRRCSQVFL